ncbi:MAG TPA: hypothetical protein VHT49_04865, partial [Acidimicrobiales bacterium]|nr:hypothetical protein [Acidimicrobiales bacterium]
MAQGTAAVDELTLLIDEQGVNIVSNRPPAKRNVPWSAITNVWFGPTGVIPTGRIATPLDITSSGRTVRFYLYGDRVPEPQVMQLRAWLPAWQGAGGRPPMGWQPGLAPPGFAPPAPPAAAPPPPPPSSPPPGYPPAAPFPPPVGPPGWTPSPVPLPTP